MTIPTSPLRPGYFAGQSLTAQTLNDNLATEWERRWAHNRILHGSGIGQGLTVTYRIGEVELTVEPGYGIDPYGHELVLTEPVTVQVPPVPGPGEYVLLCRYDPDPTAFTDTGWCGSSGAIGWMEQPVVDFVPLAEFPSVSGSALPLATVVVTECVLSGIDFGRRQVLGPQRLPYVDGGVHRPTALEWEMVVSETAPEPRYGMRAIVDTSEAGFGGTPDYQARLTGRRWLDLEIDGVASNAMLWTMEANVVAQAANELTVEVLIPSVQIRGHRATTTSFEQFLVDNYSTGDEFKVVVATELDWAITWIGVEGSL
jgi:hypothetical protein